MSSLYFCRIISWGRPFLVATQDGTGIPKWEENLVTTNSAFQYSALEALQAGWKASPTLNVLLIEVCLVVPRDEKLCVPICSLYFRHNCAFHFHHRQLDNYKLGHDREPDVKYGERDPAQITQYTFGMQCINPEDHKFVEYII